MYDTPPSQDAFRHQIWNSYLKEYRRYAPDSMQILETRSEVKFKVTVTQLWYATLPHPKMHSHTKFEIPTSNNIRDMLLTRLFLKLGHRSSSRSQWPNYGKRHFVISRCIITPNLRFLAQILLEICSRHDILITRSEFKVTVTRKWYVTLCNPKMHLHTKFGIPIS